MKYPSHETVNAAAKELFEESFKKNNPKALWPQWESQPLQDRVRWLNKAAAQMTTQRGMDS